MSAYRDSLPDSRRALYDAAVAEAGAVLARTLADIEALAAAQGPHAVAAAAWFPGHGLGTADAIALHYEQLHAQAEDTAQAA